MNTMDTKVVTRPVGKTLYRLFTDQELVAAFHEHLSVSALAELPPETDDPETVFLRTFDERSTRYVLCLLLPLTVPALMWMLLSSSSFPWQVFGLVLDGMGALLVARGLIRGGGSLQIDAGILYYHLARPDGRFQENVPYAPMLHSVTRDTVDAIWGTTLLVAGFVLQIIAIL